MPRLRETPARVVVMYSTYGITSHEEQACRRAIYYFSSHGFPCEWIDGAIIPCQDRREAVEKISGMKIWWAPKFPQIFIKNEDGSMFYVGDWEDVQELMDCDTLNAPFVRTNHIPTFRTVFGVFFEMDDQ